MSFCLRQPALSTIKPSLFRIQRNTKSLLPISARTLPSTLIVHKMSTAAQPTAPKWGFTIYRTTYTANSDSQWSSFLSILRERALEAAAVEQPEIYTVEQLSLPAISDPKILDGATVQTVRDHFRSFAKELRDREEAGNWSSPRYEVCVLVDEEVLRAVTEEAPKPPEADLEGTGWVYLVNVGEEDRDEASEETYPEDDEGWMKVALPVLLPRCFELLKSPFAWEDTVYRPPPEVAFP